MRLNKELLFSIFFLINGILLFGQTTSKKIPLASLIATIENHYTIKFSYAVDDVKSIEIEKPSLNLTLDEVINYLNNNTLLNFKKLDNRYITISILDKKINVCGNILALDNQSKLSGATVSVTPNSTTISNANGEFTFQDIPLNAVVQISHIGYETKFLKAIELISNKKKCATVLLNPSKEELNQVVIPIFLTLGIKKYLDGSTVLNTKQFGILPGLTEPDILQTIQALPGVESTDESIANINVRGGTNDQNLMIWDNIKMYHSGHFFGLISAYNPNLTNKVIVSKNGTSAQYSEGVSSTVNMFTKDEISSKFTGGAGINLINADAFLEIPLTKKIGLDISGRRSVTDLIETPTFSNYYERSFQDSEINNDDQNGNTKSNFNFYDYTAKLLFDINKNHQFRANIIGINNALNYAETNPNSQNSAVKNSTLTQKNIGIGTTWKANWTSKTNTELITYYSKYNIESTDFIAATNQNSKEGNEVLETGLKLNVSHQINPNLKLLNGYQLTETGMLNETFVDAPAYSSTKKSVLLSNAIYSEAEYHKNNTYFRLGGRMNYFSKFKKVLFEPRLNFRQQFLQKFALEIEGEFKNQTTTQIIDFQDDFLGVEKRRWVLVNDSDIPITKSKQASVGIEFNANRLAINITSFYKIVDGITVSNQGFYNNFQFTNANGSYTAKGIEFLANKTTNKYSIWVNYTFSTNNYAFENLTPSEFPNNADIKHSTSFGLNHTIYKNLKLSFGGSWRSGHPYTTPIAGNETVQNGSFTSVNYDSPNNKNLDDFKRLDASLSYNFNFSSGVKSIIRIGIINLTNEQNSINRYYKVNTADTQKTIEVDNKSLGRTANISLRVNF